MLRYAITDGRLFGGDEAARRGALIAQAERLASEAAVEYVQLREKDIAAGELADLTRQVLAALERGARQARNGEPGGRPKLLINTRADVAIASGADGVHLTSAPSELRPGQIRRIFALAGRATAGTRTVVSLSCHTVQEVLRAVSAEQEDRPDLILFGPVFEKMTAGERVSSGTGLDLLRDACRVASGIPVLALGGVNEENAATCVAAGAAGVAAIRMFASRD